MIFRLKSLLLILCFLLPSSGWCMTAWPVSESPAYLLERPERGAPGREVLLSGEMKIMDAVYAGDAYWYQVTVEGVTGWLFQDALFVQADGSDENEQVSKLGVALTAARKSLLSGAGPDETWVRRPDLHVPADEDNPGGVVMTWAAKDAVIQIMGMEDRVNDLYFAANTAEAVRKFFGFAAMGLTAEELRDRLGRETSREQSSLRYDQGGGHETYAFRLENGTVAEVSYNFWPGNGMEFPDRVYELRRFRDAPGKDWPQSAWLGEGKIQVHKEPAFSATVLPSLNRKEMEGALVWLETKDRGEVHPWVRVELKTALGVYEQGWIYGRHLELSEGEKTYERYFRGVMAYEFRTKVDALKKSLGSPQKVDELEEEWPGVRLGYQVFHDGDTEIKYLSEVEISDSRWNLGGIRIGDSMESLQELVESLLADNWRGERKLKEGENTFACEFAEIILTIENGVLSSLEDIGRAVD